MHVQTKKCNTILIISKLFFLITIPLPNELIIINTYRPTKLEPLRNKTVLHKPVFYPNKVCIVYEYIQIKLLSKPSASVLGVRIVDTSRI